MSSCATARAPSIRAAPKEWTSGNRPTPFRTEARDLTEALSGADVFLGLSAAGALKPEMVKDMAPAPIIFAMANPDPEISPPMPVLRALTRSSQRGVRTIPTVSTMCCASPSSSAARSTCATAINEEMKIAAAYAIADLARQQVPEEVAAAYGAARRAGPEYIIPSLLDPRLMEIVPAAVAKAAMETGVAQQPIDDLEAYRTRLRARLNPTTSVLTLAYEAARANPKRVVFAEGEEEVVLRAAIQFRDGAGGIPVLVGREGLHNKLRDMGVADPGARGS